MCYREGYVDELLDYIEELKKLLEKAILSCDRDEDIEEDFRKLIKQFE